MEKIKDDNKKFTDRYVKPHHKISREVKNSDLKRVLVEAHVLYNLCYCQIGLYSGGEAVAHPQIDDKDPLRFFVTKNKKIVINPEILRHSNYEVDREEGCLSFPDRKMIMVKRWQKCDVRYYTIEKDGDTLIVVNEKLSGKEAQIFQHECQHLGGMSIFNL